MKQKFGALMTIMLVIGLMTACDMKKMNPNPNQVLQVMVNLTEKKPKNQNEVEIYSDRVLAKSHQGSANEFEMTLNQGDCLLIETEVKYPITIVMKDKSTSEVVYQEHKYSHDNQVIVDAVLQDGTYEVVIDFNELEVFTYHVYLLTEKELENINK